MSEQEGISDKMLASILLMTKAAKVVSQVCEHFQNNAVLTKYQYWELCKSEQLILNH
jgi:hypothetical protein